MNASHKRCLHFQAKVLWSAIAYNIRVMTGIILGKLLKTSVKKQILIARAA